MFFILVLILMGCNQQNEEVREGLEEESSRVIEIVQTAVLEERLLTTEEQLLLNEFEEKYSNTSPQNENEDKLIGSARLIIMHWEVIHDPITSNEMKMDFINNIKNW